jgi:hypothetical protein
LFHICPSAFIEWMRSVRMELTHYIFVSYVASLAVAPNRRIRELARPIAI